MNHFAPLQAPPLPPDARLTITLPVAEWNAIRTQLAERPHRLVAPILDQLRAQLALAAHEQQTRASLLKHP